tara:strand:- start:45 stop:353 length:309 start_codon:yes stop_codon:yes gene_type:complete
MKKIKNIIQINISRQRSGIKINVWKFCVLLFFMALVSVCSSFYMDKKIIQKHKNEKYLEQLKSSFVFNKKTVNDLRSQIIDRVKEKSFGFIKPKKEDVIIIY